MTAVISIANLSKTYASGFEALRNINLEIRRGEIFALLGPNGAGKTTLISIICGLVKASAGSVRVDGHDIVTEYRGARSQIGLVPQELTVEVLIAAERVREIEEEQRHRLRAGERREDVYRIDRYAHCRKLSGEEIVRYTEVRP